MNNLTKIIDEKGLKRTWIARKTGILPQNICAYEKDRLKITQDVAIAFADVLNVTVEEIIGDEGKSISN